MHVEVCAGGMRPVKRDGEAAHGIDRRHGKHRAAKPGRKIEPVTVLILQREGLALRHSREHRLVCLDPRRLAAVPALAVAVPLEYRSFPAERCGGSELQSVGGLVREQPVDLGRLLGGTDGLPKPLSRRVDLPVEIAVGKMNRALVQAGQREHGSGAHGDPCPARQARCSWMRSISWCSRRTGTLRLRPRIVTRRSGIITLTTRGRRSASNTNRQSTPLTR